MIKKIMIVDDDLVTRCVLRDILETGGHKVIAEVRTGEEALEIYGSLLLDFIIIDIVLPGKNGLAVANDLLSIDRHAKIILISVLDDINLIKAGFTLGVVDFIHKPFTADKVLLAIQNNGTDHITDETTALP